MSGLVRGEFKEAGLAWFIVTADTASCISW